MTDLSDFQDKLDADKVHYSIRLGDKVLASRRVVSLTYLETLDTPAEILGVFDRSGKKVS